MEPDGVADPALRARLEALGPELRLALRRSYMCDCVERWDYRPGRVTLPVLEGDPAEEVLSGIAEVTGVRPPGCPNRQLRDPFVNACIRAHRGFVKGDMSGRLGPEAPAALVVGVECFDAALNAIEAHDMKADRPKPPGEDGGSPKPRAKRRR